MEQITLTPKQQRFCDEYLVDLNATKAALRAGYSGATALNGKLMTIPKIRYYLQQRTEAATKKAQVNHEMILSELCKIAFGNMGNYFEADGSLKYIQDLTADEKAALGSLTVTESNGSNVSTTTRIKMHNKMSALDKLAKHLNFYNAEERQPEVVYVYIDKNNVDDHDRYDDAYFDDEDDDNEYWDEDDGEIYKYDTECRMAIADAKAAYKARRAKAGSEGSVVSGEEDEDEWEEEEEFEEDEDGGQMTEGGERSTDLSKMTVQEMTKRIMDSQAAMNSESDEMMGAFEQKKEVYKIGNHIQVTRMR
jgi:hypothetical protein